MPQPPKAVLKMWEQEFAQLSPEQRLTAYQLASGQPITASANDMFQWLHSLDFPNVLFGLLPKEPFDGYRGCAVWQWQYIEDLSVMYRNLVCPNGGEEYVDDGSIVVAEDSVGSVGNTRP